MPIQADRRQLLRTGVWSLPVISMAAAAPAFASSGSNLSGSTVVASRPGGQVGRFTLSLRNPGTTTTALKVTFTVDSLTTQPVAPAQPQPPVGWTITAINVAAGTIEYTASTQISGADGTVVVVFNVQRNSNGATSGTVRIDPGGGGQETTLPYTFGA